MTKLQKDHLMILLESIESKMQFTVEAVGSLNDKIDGVASLHKKVDAVDKKVDAVEKNLSRQIEKVHSELLSHRNDTELHRSQPKRSLKRIV